MKEFLSRNIQGESVDDRVWLGLKKNNDETFTSDDGRQVKTFTWEKNSKFSKFNFSDHGREQKAPESVLHFYWGRVAGNGAIAPKSTLSFASSISSRNANFICEVFNLP